MARKSVLSKLYSGFQSRMASERQDPALPSSRNKTPSLKLVFFIVDWHRAHIVSDVFVEEKVRFHFTAKGMGTASSEILDLLGIGASDKAVIFCLEQSVGVPVLLKEVQKKFRHNTPGGGIAFTVPLSAINDPILLVFKQSIHKNEKIASGLGLNVSDEKENTQGESFTHELIISILNHGYSDVFMDTAREAGASGGTVINARGQAHEGAVKFFGISVQEEKEIILILTNREKKENIMSEVCKTYGMDSKAQGIVFSLPVDNVMGLVFE